MVVNSDTDSKKVRRAPADEAAIARFFSNLLGREVRVTSGREDDFSDTGAVIATYSDRGDKLAALCIFDISAAAGLAVSASIIKGKQLETALAKKKIDGVLRERLYALCELIGSLFGTSTTSENGDRLMFRDLVDISEVSADVRALLDSHSVRRDVRIEISGNGYGHVALLAR